MKKFENWLSENTTIKKPKNYVNGIQSFEKNHNLPSLSKMSKEKLDILLQDFDTKTVFAKNEKSHLKQFVIFKGLEPDNYDIFSRKKSEKKSKKTENHAIDTIKKYYQNNGYEVSSVESKKIGWDLEAIKGKEKLLLEVKGLDANNSQVIISANEYISWKENNDNYRLCIVANCKSAQSKRIIKIVKCVKNKYVIENDNDNTIVLKEEVRAILIYK